MCDGGNLLFSNVVAVRLFYELSNDKTLDFKSNTATETFSKDVFALVEQQRFACKLQYVVDVI